MSSKVAVDVQALLSQELQEKELLIEHLNGKIKELSASLKYEQTMREAAEKKAAVLQEELDKPVAKRKRRTKAEMEAANEHKEYSEFKSNGIRKKQKVEAIRSYTDFKKIQDYFLEKRQIRNYVLWTVGVCFGVRVSDLCVLKWKNVLNGDYTFKERVMMYERKTNKVQNCKITKAAQKALGKLMNYLDWEFDFEDYIFAGSDKTQHLTERTIYKIIDKAAKDVGIEYNVGTHTMRSTFANIVLCVDKNTIDMNAITKIQGLLNHSDPRVTMRYLGTLSKMYDSARDTVSDFVLGKTGVDELVCGNMTSLDDVMGKLNDLEAKLVT